MDYRKHAFIRGYISSADIPNVRPLRFIVDTGSTYTTIMSQDAYKLEIDCCKLRKSDCVTETAKGQLNPYELPDVTLQLEKKVGSKKGMAKFPLGVIHCLPPPDDLNKVNPLSHVLSYSLLGMDVLQFFKKWQYTDSTLILET